jgi:hypothetical protein
MQKHLFISTEIEFAVPVTSPYLSKVRESLNSAISTIDISWMSKKLALMVRRKKL